MGRVMFFVGEPGVGKTTLARRFLEQDCYLVAKPKWTVGELVCAAGHYTGGTFDGADTVPYNGVNDALRFWREQLYSKPMTLFDGDRFSYEGVLAQLQGLASLHCVLLTVPEHIAEHRRAERGSKQDPTWIRGRRTKAERFAATVRVSGGQVLTVDACQSTSEMEIAVRSWLRTTRP